MNDFIGLFTVIKLFLKYRFVTSFILFVAPLKQRGDIILLEEVNFTRNLSLWPSRKLFFVETPVFKVCISFNLWVVSYEYSCFV